MWARAFAGIVPGFFLSAGLVGLATWLWPGPWQAALVPGLVAFFLVWMCVIGATFFFANGTRAWIWTSVGAIASLGGLWALQASGWAV